MFFRRNVFSREQREFVLLHELFHLIYPAFILFCSQKWFSGEELDVKAIMDTWTLQEGFPLVTVEVRGRQVRVSQERYIKTDDPSLTEG